MLLIYFSLDVKEFFLLFLLSSYIVILQLFHLCSAFNSECLKQPLSSHSQKSPPFLCLLMMILSKPWLVIPCFSIQVSSLRSSTSCFSPGWAQWAERSPTAGWKLGRRWRPFIARSLIMSCCALARAHRLTSARCERPQVWHQLVVICCFVCVKCSSYERILVHRK